MTRPLRLGEFLGQVNVPVAREPPLVHSTSAHRLLDIVQDGKLLAMPCNVFKGDKLNYCFVGRPAYKAKSLPSPAEWELPVAFVLRFHNPPRIKRVFPFDSGAFQKRRLPTYITCFKLDRFDLSSDPNHIGRLISFFFDTPERYFMRVAKSADEIKKEHNLDLRHSEVSAVSRLFQEHSSNTCDDRAAAIEVQIEEDITLARDNLLGVVMPDEFTRVRGFVDSLKQIAGTIRTYTHFPLGTDAHYGFIYDGVRDIYKKAGITL